MPSTTIPNSRDKLKKWLLKRNEKRVVYQNKPIINKSRLKKLSIYIIMDCKI